MSRLQGWSPWVLILCWTLFAAVEYLAIRAAAGIENNDRLERTFESRSPAFQRFQDVSAKYGSTETDILVLFEADSFGDPARQGPVEDFLIDVQFVRHIALAVSPFSFRISGADGMRELLLPDEIKAKATTVDEIRAIADTVTQGTGVTATLTGFPVLRTTVVERLSADFVVLNLVGLVAGSSLRSLPWAASRLA